MKRLRQISVFFCGCFVFWAAGLAWFVQQIPGVSQHMDADVDAIVVLTGGHERIKAGFDLWQRDQDNILFISGVGERTSLTALMKENDIVLEPDINTESIYLGQQATSTKGNAEEVTQWLQQKDFHRFILITTNYHAPRALLEFYPYRDKLTIWMYPVFSSSFQLDHLTADGKSLRLLFREYHKYLATALRLLLEPRV